MKRTHIYTIALLATVALGFSSNSLAAKQQRTGPITSFVTEVGNGTVAVVKTVGHATGEVVMGIGHATGRALTGVGHGVSYVGHKTINAVEGKNTQHH
jgi:hypothetical protein